MPQENADNVPYISKSLQPLIPLLFFYNCTAQYGMELGNCYQAKKEIITLEAGPGSSSLQCAQPVYILSSKAFQKMCHY